MVHIFSTCWAACNVLIKRQDTKIQSWAGARFTGSMGRFADSPHQCHLREPLLSQTGCSRAVLCIKIADGALRAPPFSLSEINFNFISISASLASSTLCQPVLSSCCPLPCKQSCTWTLPVINVGCVAAHVSNHNSSVKASLPGSGRHVWAHGALQCLLLYKTDFKYSHPRGEAPIVARRKRTKLIHRSLTFLPSSLAISGPLLASPLFYCDKTLRLVAWIPKGSFLDSLFLFVCW